MKKIFILGHNGMLGNAVLKYYRSKNNYILYTAETRFDSEEFKTELKNSDAEYIINCIGKIPQKSKNNEDLNEYKTLNIELPIFLESLGKKILHPSTDCEFLGDLEESKKYNKNSVRDAKDEYGLSKSYISEKIEKDFVNTKILRVSIIGHEKNTFLSLLDWFLSQEKETNGYTNHYWNGITTLEWSKISYKIVSDWNSYPVLNTFGTEEINSKYQLLKVIKEVYGKEIIINEYKTPNTVNKCMESDIVIPNIKTQLVELKSFYAK